MRRRPWTRAIPLIALLAIGCGGRTPPQTFDVPPVLANREEVTAALRAMGGGLEARVVLMMRIDADGRVQEVRIHRSSGDEGLDEAALWVGERMRFEPAQHQGQPVAAWIQMPVTFDVVRPGIRVPRLRNASSVAAIMAREYADLEGTVVLRIRVDATGRVTQVRSLRSEGRALFEAARGLVNRLDLWPAREGFRVVDAWANLRFEFDGPRSSVQVEDDSGD